MNDSAWIEAVSQMTYGIYILTSSHSDKINGMIASWVSQVSFDPPMIMVAIHPNRFTHQLVSTSGKFALNIMGKNQKKYLSKFKGPDPQLKFDQIPWEKGDTGCPIILDSVAFLECEVKEIYNPGNHTLFLGEILRGGLLSQKEVLTTLDYEGIYLGKA